jgi:hypothetical protein
VNGSILHLENRMNGSTLHLESVLNSSTLHLGSRDGWWYISFRK